MQTEPPAPGGDGAIGFVDALVGRALGDDLDPPRPPARPPERSARGPRHRVRRPSRPSAARLRGMAAAAVVAVLAVAAVVATRAAGTPDAPLPPPAAAAAGPTGGAREDAPRPPAGADRPVPDARALRDAVGAPPACAGEGGAEDPEPVLRCTIDGVAVSYRAVADLTAAYARVAPDDGVAELGPARCARGLEDERAWSSPSTPGVAAGRYRCRVTGARAELWWTVDAAGVLAHASADDGDLGALFAWWLALPSPASGSP